MPTSMASLHYFHLRDMKYDYISCTLVLAFRSCFITRFHCLCVFTNQERDDACRYLSQGCTPCDTGVHSAEPKRKAKKNIGSRTCCTVLSGKPTVRPTDNRTVPMPQRYPENALSILPADHPNECLTISPCNRPAVCPTT